MKCPQCNNVIPEFSKTCDSCNYVFSNEILSKLSVYFELKKEITIFSNYRDSFDSSIEQLNQKINRFTNLLSKDVENSTKSSVADISQEYFQPTISNDRPSIDEIKQGQSVKRKETEEKGRSQLEINLGQKWLLVIGIITMVFGVGYFLKYSFEQGWISPTGRIAMAYMWGAAFLVLGDQFRKKRFEIYGLSLVGGGIAILYFSTFAAFHLYHLFGQSTSFIIMVLITILASILAIIYDTKLLAILGLIGGFLTPFMLSTGQDNQIFLMTYMTILNFGLLSVAFYKKWDVLNIMGFAATYLLYAGWFVTHYAESKFWPAIIFLNIFYFTYCIIPFAYHFIRVARDSIKGFIVIIPNSFFAFGFSYFMIKEHFSLEWVSVITILYSLVFISMASYLYKKDMYKNDAFVVFLGKAALFLIITIPIVFSEHWITIFWVAQALILLWTGLQLNRKSLIKGSYVLMILALSKFLYFDYPAVFSFDLQSFHIKGSYSYIIVERFVTSIFLLSVLYFFARSLKKVSLSYVSNTFNESSNVSDSSTFYGVWCIVLFVVLNMETSSFFYHYLINARFAAISVLWSVFSVVLMIKGFKDNISFVRLVSLGLFFITLVKVFLFDMSNVNTPYRILSFVILGLVMIGTSYLYHRYKDKIISAFAAEINDPSE